MLIADHSVDQAPIVDSFKSVHVKKPPKPTGQDPCTEKVNHAVSKGSMVVEY